jgi:hypothetical protein
MYTSTDVTLTITHDNGTSLTASAKITGSSFTGMTLRCTGIAAGESMGAKYKTVFSPAEQKVIVTGVIVRIDVTGGAISWATTPDYTITLGSTITYVWILPGEENSAASSIDGIWTTTLKTAGSAPSSISDIDVYVYADGDDLDNTILLDDVSAGIFTGYTAAESILNMDVI